MAITRYDVAQYLESREAQSQFMLRVLTESDPEEFRTAIEAVAMARGISEIARAVGVEPDRLCQALSDPSGAESELIQEVAQALASDRSRFSPRA
jgi:probable addiction module antidote protein